MITFWAVYLLMQSVCLCMQSDLFRSASVMCWDLIYSLASWQVDLQKLDALWMLNNVNCLISKCVKERLLGLSTDEPVIWKSYIWSPKVAFMVMVTRVDLIFAGFFWDYSFSIFFITFFVTELCKNIPLTCTAYSLV